MPIRLTKVSYVYKDAAKINNYSLKNVDIEINENEFLFIVGKTGSGKSTLLQLLNALEKPSEGKVYFDNEDIWAPSYSRRNLRFQVGVVFQYPEHQLFAETVLEDVMYGVKNKGKNVEEARKEAEVALTRCKVHQSLWDKSPFELSGGQQRKVAIAGILAMNPKYLVLDEPTAGLDPFGREELFQLLLELKEKGKTIVVVSHSMDDVARYADRVICLNEGKVVYDLPPLHLFKEEKALNDIGLGLPQLASILSRLEKYGFNYEWDFDPQLVANKIAKWIKKAA